MCLISREHLTRRMRKGDMAVIGQLPDYHGTKRNAAVPVNVERGILCYCVKEGFTLELTGLPAKFLQAHALVSPKATVTFREGTLYPPMPDKVEFVNGEVVRFDDLPQTVAVLCVSESPSSRVRAQETGVDGPLPDDPEPEPEPVLVRRAAGVARSLVGAGLTAAVLIGLGLSMLL